MQIETFKRIINTFADPQSPTVWDKDRLLVQVYGDTNEVTLRIRAGEVAVVDGGNEMSAIQWVLSRLAKLPLLADRLLATIPATEPFITPEGNLLHSLDMENGDQHDHVTDISSALLQLLDERSPLETTVTYITSDAGEGKTCIINEIARCQAKRFKNRTSDWLLIPIPLGGRSFLRFDDIVAAALANRYRFPYFYYAAFLELVRLGVLVPAFDGFEEMFVENTSGEALSAMGILLNSLQSSGSLLVAARKAYFEFENLKTQASLYDAIKLYAVSFGKIALSRWEKTQFVEYGKARTLPDPESLYEKAVQRLGLKHPLVTRPVLVRRLVDIALKSSSVDEFLVKLQISGPDFFSVFVRGIIEREANEKWLYRSSQEEVTHPLLSVEEHCEILSLIALEMWQARVEFIKSEALEFVTDFFCESRQRNAELAAQIRQRIKGHALIIASPNVHGAFEFDHEEFRQFFLGEGIARQALADSKSIRANLLNVLRRGALPSHAFTAFVTALRRENSKRQRELVSLLCEVARLDGQTSFTHENSACIIMATLNTLDGEPLVLSRLSFPPNSLRDKKLRNVTFEECFFSPSSLENTELTNCKFKQCHFGRLDLFQSTKFDGVKCAEASIDSVAVISKDVILYEPGACRSELVAIGVSFEEGPVLITEQHYRRKAPEEAVKQMQRVLRYFLRNTHISESIIRMRLGSGGMPFISDCIPALLNRGIFIESFRLADQRQRHFKLGRPMAVLNEALENCSGQFSEFLDLADRHAPTGG